MLTNNIYCSHISTKGPNNDLVGVNISSLDLFGDQYFFFSLYLFNLIILEIVPGVSGLSEINDGFSSKNLNVFEPVIKGMMPDRDSLILYAFALPS